MEGNASVYQVTPVSRIAGEGRAEVLRTWDLVLIKREPKCVCVGRGVKDVGTWF